MSYRLYPYRWYLAASSVTLLGLLWLISPFWLLERVPTPETEDTKYGFGDTRTVGQSFKPVPHLSGITISATLGDEAQGPLLLHVRESYFGPDIRTSALFQPTSEPLEFSFTPLIRSYDHLVWVLESPHDPDQSAALFREIDGSAYPHGEAFVKGVPLPGDFGFEQQGYRTLGSQVLKPGKPLLEQLKPLERRALITGLIAAMLVLYGWRGIVRIGKYVVASPKMVVGLLALASFILHAVSAQNLPVNNDEGAYLQDAFQVSHGFVPVRDFLTKGPVYVYTLALWKAIIPTDITLLRLLSAISSSVSVWLMFRFAQELLLPRTLALGSAALLAISPAAILLSTPLLLQTLSVPLILASLTVLLIGIRKRQTWYIAGSAMLVVAAYLTRASSLVIVLLGIGIILVQSRQRWRDLIVFLLTGLFITATLATLAWNIMGIEKTAILFNAEALIIAEKRAAIAQQAAEPVIRQATFWTRILWKSSPWLLTGIVLAPFSFVSNRRKVISLLVIAAVALVLIEVARHIIDADFFVLQSYSLFIGLLFIFLFGVFGLATLRWVQTRIEVNNRAISRASIIVLVWLGLLTLLYKQWGSFTDNYLLEFLPSLALLSAIGGYILALLFQKASLITRQLLVSGFTFLIVCGAVGGWQLGFQYPHTGDMQIAALQQVTEIIQSHTNRDEPIFTAQSAVTALSDRPIMLNYSHSGWYLYEKRGTVSTELRQLLFAEPQVVTEYLQNTAQLVVIERRTSEVYFKDYPDRQAILKNEFHLIAEVSNISNDPFLVYQRK